MPGDSFPGGNANSTLFGDLVASATANLAARRGRPNDGDHRHIDLSCEERSSSACRESGAPGGIGRRHGVTTMKNSRQDCLVAHATPDWQAIGNDVSVGAPQRSVDAGHGVAALTDREIEVMRCLALGNSKAQAGTMLHISANTVNRHTTNLMAKVNVHNRAELTRLAVRCGVIDP